MISFFSPRTVASALAPLTQIVKNLERVNQGQIDIQVRNIAQIERLQADNAAADKEQGAAARVLNALRQLTDPKE